MRAHLREQRVGIAEVSIDADDWAFNPPFARCTERGDVAALGELRRLFVEVHVDELRRMREAGRSLMGREIRQVLLLHLGVADADALDALLTAYEQEGVRFVPLETALADDFYESDPGPPHTFGGAYPYVVARARGTKLALPPMHERDLEGRLARTWP